MGRQIREKTEQVATERHEALVAELRREQRQHDATEATLRKEIEDVRQLTLKFAAGAERQTLEGTASLEEETSNRAKSVEVLLEEWAGSQQEIRQAMEVVRSDIDRAFQDHERHDKSFLREASTREAFEQFFGEKMRNVEVGVDKLASNHFELETRLEEAHDATRMEAAERAACHQDLQMSLAYVQEQAQAGRSRAATSELSPTTLIPLSPGAPAVTTARVTTV